LHLVLPAFHGRQAGDEHHRDDCAKNQKSQHAKRSAPSEVSQHQWYMHIAFLAFRYSVFVVVTAIQSPIRNAASDLAEIFEEPGASSAEILRQERPDG
jgi:hypothetical protein